MASLFGIHKKLGMLSQHWTRTHWNGNIQTLAKWMGCGLRNVENWVVIIVFVVNFYLNFGKNVTRPMELMELVWTIPEYDCFVSWCMQHFPSVSHKHENPLMSNIYKIYHGDGVPLWDS